MASKGKYVRVTIAHDQGKFPADLTGYLVVGYIKTGSVAGASGRDLLLERQYTDKSKAPAKPRKSNRAPMATDTAAVVPSA